MYVILTIPIPSNSTAQILGEKTSSFCFSAVGGHSRSSSSALSSSQKLLCTGAGPSVKVKVCLTPVCSDPFRQFHYVSLVYQLLDIQTTHGAPCLPGGWEKVSPGPGDAGRTALAAGLCLSLFSSSGCGDRSIPLAAMKNEKIPSSGPVRPAGKTYVMTTPTHFESGVRDDVCFSLAI